MTTSEAVNAARLLSAVNGALGDLGQPPITDHPDFESVEVPGRVAAFELRRVNSAPFRFEFGYELEVVVDSVPEVYVAVPTDLDRVRADIKRLLKSEIVIVKSPKRMEVAFRDPSGELWLKSGRRAVFGEYARDQAETAARYAPAFSPG